MIYTIATLEDQIGTILSLVKDGNQYRVELYDKERHNGRSTEKVDTIDAAYKIFERLVEPLVKGEYSFEDRYKLLTGEEVE